MSNIPSLFTKYKHIPLALALHRLEVTRSDFGAGRLSALAPLRHWQTLDEDQGPSIKEGLRPVSQSFVDDHAALIASAVYAVCEHRYGGEAGYLASSTFDPRASIRSRKASTHFHIASEEARSYSGRSGSENRWPEPG